MSEAEPNDKVALTSEEKSAEAPKDDLEQYRVEQYWSAPLPPPVLFNEYPVEAQDHILSGLKKEMTHRHEIEIKEAFGRTMMIVFAFLVAIAFIIGIVAIAYFAKEAFATIFGGIALGAIGVHYGGKAFRAVALLKNPERKNEDK